ncbi:MAG: DUF3179 domain-containing (seleno)protein [Saprospiraceae bacterium]
MHFLLKNSILLLFLSFPSWNLAQVTINGNIKDQDTGVPIETAYIFIANTQIGTISDAAGNFTLSNVPTGSVNIVISHLSYKPFSKPLSFLQGAAYDWNIKLEADIVGLSEVAVKAKPSKKRKKYIKRFTKALLGNTPNAKLCHIRNTEVLRFTEEKNILTVKAKHLLEIENFALGYRIFFYLEKFKLKGEDVSYAGKPLFEELLPKSAAQRATWYKNRARSYRGSLQHFYRSVIEETTKQEGFKIYKAKLTPNKTFESSPPVNIKTLVKASPDGSQRWLAIPNFLKIVYSLEFDQLTQKGTEFNAANANIGRPAEREMMLQSRNNAKQKMSFQQSYLFSLFHLIKLDKNAIPIHADKIKSYGYWSLEGVAEMLPMTYRLPDGEIINVQTSTILQKESQKNGFSLSQLRIPKSQILAGGPPKDGIPAIDHPKFVTIAATDFLEDDDEVLSIEIGGIAKAYPIKILNFHELVNDQIKDQAILVSYCPLCNSGIIFSRAVEGKTRSFGVSGLLYNSDVLLYDRETESLWSQLMEQAVAGVASGQRLKPLASKRLTWRSWKEKYPQGQVLSTETGFTKDYQTNPYAKYKGSSRLLFPVEKESRKLKRKTKVIGIALAGQYRAYPLKTLAKRKSPIVDQWNDQEIRIYLDEQKQVVKVEDRNGLPLVYTQLYWFAWYAFHPRTSIFPAR